MTRMTFINLAVASPAAARTFYEALGFTLNEQYSDETTSCIMLNEHTAVMLAELDKLRGFSEKEFADHRTHTTSLISFSVDSREEVDAIVARAAANGGAAVGDPQDYGFMYDHAFADPDGHHWGILAMTVDPEPVAAYDAGRADG